MRPNIDSIAQKDPRTASHAERPPSGNVNVDEADMREATRSGNLDGT